jgi:hypothetical protein
MSLYQHIPHPRHHTRVVDGPATSRRAHRSINDWLALKISSGMASMYCAYVFVALALVALPSAIAGGLFTFVMWLSQTLIQLTALSILAVGQRILGEAGDKRAEQTYHDASATLHECLELQKHLQAQDEVLARLLAHLQERPS